MRKLIALSFASIIALGSAASANDNTLVELKELEVTVSISCSQHKVDPNTPFTMDEKGSPYANSNEFNYTLQNDDNVNYQTVGKQFVLKTKYGYYNIGTLETSPEEYYAAMSKQEIDKECGYGDDISNLGPSYKTRVKLNQNYSFVVNLKKIAQVCEYGEYNGFDGNTASKAPFIVIDRNTNDVILKSSMKNVGQTACQDITTIGKGIGNILLSIAALPIWLLAWLAGVEC